MNTKQTNLTEQSAEEQQKPRGDVSVLDSAIGSRPDAFARQMTGDNRMASTLIERVTTRLPEALASRQRAEQLILGAMSYFTRQAKASQRFQKCTGKSLVDCIVDAADFGLRLDGKLAYAVPYGQVAQFQPSYLGMLAVAKRLGLVDDVWARLVMPEDLLTLSEVDGQQRYQHEQDLDTPRDYATARGVLAVATTKHGVRFEWLAKPEIEDLRKRSQAADSGPWKTDAGEMAKKAAIRRLLKGFSEDPSMMELMSKDDDREPIGDSKPSPPVDPFAMLK